MRRQSQSLRLKGPVGLLEARLQLPANDQPRASALVLHPHPLHGGTMANKVVQTLVRASVEAGAATLCFNFRGVGGSDGEHDHGHGEQDDALTAVAWLAQAYPNLPLWLSGFSFGAATAIRIAGRAQAQRLISVAAPGSYFNDGTPAVPCPWLVIHGEADEVASWADAQRWLAGLPQSPKVLSKAGVGHFFHGELGWLRHEAKKSLVDS